MTDLFLLATGGVTVSKSRARVPGCRSLITYAPLGDGLPPAQIRRLLSGAPGGPEPRLHSAAVVENARLLPVSEAQRLTVAADFEAERGELSTLPKPMWLCSSPTLCSPHRHVCTGVLGPAFDAYKRIHVLELRDGTERGGPVAGAPEAGALARAAEAFLCADYATTRVRWEELSRTERARLLAFDGVLLWFQVHGSNMRAAGAEGEFSRLHDVLSAATPEQWDALHMPEAGHWPWAVEFTEQLRAEERVLDELAECFDHDTWTALSETGRLRALEIYRAWGSHYPDSVMDALATAGLLVPGRLTAG
ncbi:hypothetical protein LG634_06975 [Streptomyces bambusae]|uniref:hypothetical protein n=1 Tax=Streptomyces bambusae TaxID=1550616 RepID=UPI001CFDCC40|nr:hypothetical protein [Streptomyces bambusae]MCB5164576.1 hypothetical protein [Streptomyces bambusae]